MIFIFVRVSTLQNKSVQLIRKIKIYNSNQLLGLRTQVLVIKSLKLNSPGALEVLEYKIEAAKLKMSPMYLPGASGTWRGMKGSDTLRSGMPESTACPPFLFSAGVSWRGKIRREKMRKAENIK